MNEETCTKCENDLTTPKFVATPTGVKCINAECTNAQGWDSDDDYENLSDKEIEERFNQWVGSLTKEQSFELIKLLIKMGAEQEMVCIGTGAPYHYHSGDPLLKE
jgi:hypothetical protein